MTIVHGLGLPHEFTEAALDDARTADMQALTRKALQDVRNLAEALKRAEQRAD